MDFLSESLGGLFKRTDIKGKYEKYGIEVISPWPFEKKINNQRRILIDPSKDQVLANFLDQVRALNEPQNEQITTISRVSTLVHDTMKYNEKYFEDTQFGPDMYLGQYILGGGVCSTLTLLLHTGLASISIDSKMCYPGNIPHAAVVVESAEAVVDPTSKQIRTAKTESDLKDIVKEMYGVDSFSLNTHVKPLVVQ